MVAINVKGFGGMVPLLDDRLLPDNNAAESENTYLYAGVLIGLPTPTTLHTNASSSIASVYRIPLSYGDPLSFSGDTWLEFTNDAVNVLRANVVDDSFDRYYIFQSSDVPRYNTRYRLDYAALPATQVVTFSSATDLVTWATHGKAIGDTLTFTNSGGALPTPLAAATTYYVSSDTFTAGSFKLSTSYANAVAGTSINLTSNGTGTTTAHTDTAASWKLGVPAPTSAISGSVSGGAAPTEARSYVCTYVSAYGEEGPPSDPVVITGNIDGSWDLTLPAADSNDLGVDRILSTVRIYRTVSGTDTTDFFLVAEQNITDTTYSDTTLDADVAENQIIESTEWSGPPTDLEGCIAMPNGMFVGWRSNELWFCEPFRPHAWPASYVQVVEYPIVGLGVVNQTLVICTNGLPATGTGINPSVFTMASLAQTEPCVSRGSIVSTPEGVYYASPNGLVLVTPGQAQNITANVIDKSKWQNLTNLTALKMCRLGTALYAFGSARLGVFESTAFESTAFVQEDLTGALNGILLDVNNARVAFNVLTTDTETLNVFNDAWSGELFMIRDGDVLWLDQNDDQPFLEPYLWRSKIFQMQEKRNLGVMRVYFEVPVNTPAQQAVGDNTLVQTLGTDQYGLVRVYCDGVLSMTRELRTSGQLMRLPSGFKYDFIQFEIEARVKVLSFQAASTAKELQSV